MPDTLIARSALGTASAAALRSHGDVSTVRLREIALPCMLDLRLDPDDRTSLLAAESALGVTLPLIPAATAGELASVLWCGPDQWLVMPATSGDALTHALRACDASVVHVSDLRAAFELDGLRAADVLRKGCAIDLHPREFRRDSVALTALARVRVLIHQLDNASSYDIYVERSVAAYLWHWLCDAMIEYVESGRASTSQTINR